MSDPVRPHDELFVVCTNDDGKLVEATPSLTRAFELQDARDDDDVTIWNYALGTAYELEMLRENVGIDSKWLRSVLSLLEGDLSYDGVSNAKLMLKVSIERLEHYEDM